jgi:outer membrane protein OmpA-like peptidoglycan-associated protein
MRRILCLSLLLVSPLAIARAQQQTVVDSEDPEYSHRHPSWTNSLEIGIDPTARHYTPDVGVGHGYGSLWGGGFTGTLAYHFAPVFSLEAGYSDTWNPSIVSQRNGYPLTQLATLSLVASLPTSFPIVPYVAGGAGYNWFQFHGPSDPYPLLHDANFWIWQPAAGFKFKLSYNTALRLEANMDVNHGQRASYGGFFGLSFFPGATPPAKPIRRVTVTLAPVHDTVTVQHTDTIVRVRTDTLHTTNTVTVNDTSVILVVSDVNFGFGRSELRPRALPLLRRGAQQLTTPPLNNTPIEIRGYTDSIGSDAYNYKLGLARAQAVADYLEKQGVPASQITVSSGGKNDPIAPNNTEAGRAQNRRVVIRHRRAGSSPQ